MNLSEVVLWQHLRARRGRFKFRRQHPIDQYVLDFYCHEARVCVEHDGESHEGREDRDIARDEHLESLGILTIRVENSVLFACFEDVPPGILQICEERAGGIQ